MRRQSTVVKGLLVFLALMHTTNASRTVDYLNSITGKFTVAGIHNRHSKNPTQFTDQAKEVTGRYPALWSGDFLFEKEDIDNRWKMINEANTQWQSGNLINIMWHSCNPAITGLSPCNWNVGSGPRSYLNDNQWKDLLTSGTALNSKWKAMMDDVAQYLRFLQDKGVEVMFRPFHEMNQGSFWWGGRAGSEGTRKLYQMSHDYFVREKGLTSLIWVWDMQDFGGLVNDLQNYNPGGNYWDVAALDVYEGFQGWKYQAMVNVAGGKPIGIGECDKLPDANRLSNESRWSFFMSWSELTFLPENNSKQAIVDLYNSGRVITRDELNFSSTTGAAVSLQSAHGNYLSAWNDDGVRLQPSLQNWERWTKVPMGNGKIALRSYHGTFLSAWTDGRIRQVPQAQGWEMWTEVQNSDGSVSLLSHRGTYLSAWPDGSVRQAPHNQGWEHWRGLNN